MGHARAPQTCADSACRDFESVLQECRGWAVGSGLGMLNIEFQEMQR